jgi:hypothetical protein
MGAGALAAVSVIGAGLVPFPTTQAQAPTSAPVPAPAGARVAKVQRPVTYVRLKPGQRAPKGARVIREAAPTPRVVVRRVVVSAPARSTQTASRSTRTVARTRQSGR